MNIAPGYYQASSDAYNVLGISTNKENGERCMLCQLNPTPLFGKLTLLSSKVSAVFERGIQNGQFELLERYHAPIIIGEYPSSIITPGLYGHFKDAFARYNVIGDATTFGSRESREQHVVYQPLQGEHRYALRHLPIGMFTELLKDQKIGDAIYSGPRFFKLECISAPPHIVVECQD